MTVPEVMRNAQIECAKALLIELAKPDYNTHKLRCKTKEDSPSGDGRPWSEAIRPLHDFFVEGQGDKHIISYWNAFIFLIDQHPQKFLEAIAGATSDWKQVTDAIRQQCDPTYHAWRGSWDEAAPYKSLEFESWIKERDVRTNAVVYQIEDIEQLSARKLLMKKLLDFAIEIKKGKVAQTASIHDFELGRARQELFLWSSCGDGYDSPTADEAEA